MGTPPSPRQAGTVGSAPTRQPPVNGQGPDSDRRASQLSDKVRALLDENADSLPFHGWAHTDFVTSKATEFANERGANIGIVRAAALVHDLNYVVKANSTPEAGAELRHRLLTESGYEAGEIDRIDDIVAGAHTANRQPEVDDETACLSDADTLYKALPITPVLYAHRYLAENNIDLDELADKIIREQAAKLEDGYYFYDAKLMERYKGWVEANLGLWEAIRESLNDRDVSELVACEQSR